MAGDWIKMRNNLWDDPRVSSLCDITGASEATIIGGLYWLWSSADEHTEDGYMPGLSVTGIDRKTGIKGLGDGLISIGWIEDTEGGITIIRFDEHNGSSAKRRCTDAQRKANVRNLSASSEDSNWTDEDENKTCCGAREEKNIKTKTIAHRADALAGFDEFWTVYPKRKNKGDAEKAWKALRPSDELKARILAAVEVAKASDGWRKDGGQFVPYPATWLRAKGWEDEAHSGQQLGASEDPNELITLPDGRQMSRAMIEFNRRMMQ